MFKHLMAYGSSVRLSLSCGNPEIESGSHVFYYLHSPRVSPFHHCFTALSVIKIFANFLIENGTCFSFTLWLPSLTPDIFTLPTLSTLEFLIAYSSLSTAACPMDLVCRNLLAKRNPLRMRSVFYSSIGSYDLV